MYTAELLLLLMMTITMMMTIKMIITVMLSGASEVKIAGRINANSAAALLQAVNHDWFTCKLIKPHASHAMQQWLIAARTCATGTPPAQSRSPVFSSHSHPRYCISAAFLTVDNCCVAASHGLVVTCYVYCSRVDFSVVHIHFRLWLLKMLRNKWPWRCLQHLK